MEYPEDRRDLGGIGFYRLVILILAVLVSLMAWRQRQFYHRGAFPTPRAITPRGDLAADEKSTIELFQQVAPSVVYIAVAKKSKDLFKLNAVEIPQGTGSGFIWDKQGHVITNYHVIQNSNVARVILSDQTIWQAKVVGTEPDKDIAVLKINADSSRLSPIAVGTSHDLSVGQKVFAIGNPFGLDHTLTTGIISGLGREIKSTTTRPISGVIQTDAAINPGNSGGPLLDSAARLIGINTAIYSPSGAYAGIGFAVPSDTVNRIVPQLIRYGKVKKAGLGVFIFQDHVTRRMGIKGVLVREVLPGSAADRSGLLSTRYNDAGDPILGDIIIGIEEQVVNNTNDLFLILDEYQIGQTISVKIKRGNKTLAVPVTLQELK